MQTVLLIADENGKRIDQWISEKLDKYSRTYIKKLIEDNMISVDGKLVKSNYKLSTGQNVKIILPTPQKLDVKPEDIELEIIYEDEDIIVVNKPKGMVVHPAAGNYSGTLVNALMKHCGDRLSSINGIIRPGIVHRIDKDTTGVLMVAKNNIAHEKLSEMLKKHDIKRVYVAIVDGIIREEIGRIEAPIGRHTVERKKMSVNTNNGRKAITHFKVIERFKDKTFVELKLETGRTHQIRVHMSFIGHPILGDQVYGKKKNRFELQGQALHAMILGFNHPVTYEYIEFKADIPEYMSNILNDLRNNYGQ